MVLLLKVSIVLILIRCVRMQISNGSPQFCLSNDVNDGVCSVIENFFGFGPFQQVVDLIAGSLTAFTNILQIQEVLLYVTQSFGQNPLDTTNYETMSKSFNLIAFYPNSVEEPRTISTTDVLKSCDALRLNGSPVKLIWPGYGDNCNGSNPLETLFDWTPDEMQLYANISNSTIIAVDWGFAGLSCYGYIQITLCLIGKITDFFAHLLNNCVAVEEMELIGHSIGAQMIGYVAQHLKARGRQVKTAIGLDPAGPGYEFGLRCQGIQTGCAKYSIVFHSNPCQLGTCDFTFGDVNVLLNPTRTYCQPGCPCFLNPGCSHSYVLKLFLQLTQNVSFFATYTAFNPALPGLGEPAIVTIYQQMKSGYYVMNTESIRLL